MNFNINDYVKVKLTYHGMDILRKNHAKIFAHTYKVPDFVPPIVDEDGYTEFQMWYLMQEFGEYIYLGCENPFMHDIIIEEKKSK